MPRPSPADLRRARRRRLPDVIVPGLDVLFCGINPGLYSTAVGHHFARPGNRFWKVLHASGFTDRLFSPFEDARLLSLGLGITNLCPRTTATADELTAKEIARGGRALTAKVMEYRPAPGGRARHRRLPARLRPHGRGGGPAAGRHRRPRGLGAAQPERPQRPLQPGEPHPALPRAAGARRVTARATAAVMRARARRARPPRAPRSPGPLPPGSQARTPSARGPGIARCTT